jgi:predicted DCC family thiol-disulfide oxidoreductase YuxK
MVLNFLRCCYKTKQMVGDKLTHIILFDGECNFCDNSVQFIIKRDPKGRFKFASLQSETGQMLLKKYQINNDLSSFVLIENERFYLKSSAALRVCESLKGMWKFITILRVIPVPIRDCVYSFIARNRYKWFGKKESCIIPSPEVRSRFLD